ncbi:MAG: hypothetical protein R2757_04435 [Draconibacterium sp.]
MKYTLTFIVILFCFSSIQSQAQKKIKSPDLKIGVSYPYVFGNINETGGNIGEEKNIINGFPSISVEKPYSIEHKRKNKFSINPGIAYYFFNEKNKWGNETVGRDFKLDHHSLSAYSKFLFQKKFQGRSTGFAYGGVILGFNLLTKTIGTKTVNTANSVSELADEKISESGKDFFGMAYYGAVLGIQPNAKITNIIKPSFEAKFYPGLVNRSVVKNSSSTFENEMVAEISIYLGLRLD